MATMNAFYTTMKKPKTRIDHSLAERERLLVEKNRQFLISIIKSIELCGRQGWALRGHRDDSESVALNQGNFKALLNFRVDAGDGELRSHLENAPKNALYTSKTCQNDLLLCLKDYVQQIIVSEVKAQPIGALYTIEADEVTDVSNWEQLALVIRYLKGQKPVERLLEYVACDSITGEAICQNIMQSLTSVGLDPKCCRGQTYDGAGNMAGKEKGCATRFKETSPRAPYIHCANHSLNLALSKACSVSEIHCMMSAIKTTGLFFASSPKRSRQLEKSIQLVNTERREGGQNALPQIPLGKLKLLCETRWVERHTALEDFLTLYEPLIDCLDKIRTRIDETWSPKAVTEANGILTSISTPSFIVAYVCASYLFRYTKSLSKMLQGTSMDVVNAYEAINLVKDEIKSIRDNVDDEFDNLYSTMSLMAETAGIEITAPRSCHRQTLRSNVPTDHGGPKTYWKRAVFIPYLDSMLAQLNERFTTVSNQAVRGLLLLPQNLAQCTDDKVDDIVEFYGPDMPSQASIKQEIRLWKRRWTGESDVPKTISETLDVMNSKMFPNIHAVLYLLLLLPVTSAEVERAHSAFKLIKTKLRSAMGEDRLNGLMLLYQHSDIRLNYDEIVDMYARRHPRRMQFLNPLSEK
ncbi:52 kDa repressor of the inhibitor of the protein kinase-like [Diadema setosum]|uniref:52 kDa repressor of the inhibitor of the protein kinase-like n=1 Tax=Diadema setosum TaxID=31175 RepID=UPI003B3B0609